MTGRARSARATAGGYAERAAEAAAAVRERLGVSAPRLGVILGSGLGELASRIEGARRVSFRDIPGFPSVTVVGHAGALVCGTLEGREVLALAGRLHLYEGHAAQVAALPVRLLHALGARALFVSNAAGGIRRSLRAGDLMLIEDQLNLTWRTPLAGDAERGDVRFPDMSEPYDRALREAIRDVAAASGVPLVEGVYAGLLGPAYETPAEVRMLDRLGADAVGMSTVHEVIVARALGMRVAGVSCITNLASGRGVTKLTHAEVLEASARVAARLETLVRGLLARLPRHAK